MAGFVAVLWMSGGPATAQFATAPVDIVDSGMGAVRQRAPQVAVTSGAIVAVWEDFRNGASGDVYMARSTDGGQTWGANVRVTPVSSSSQIDPALGYDSVSNSLHLVWTEDSTGLPHLYHRYSTNDGATWSTAQQIESLQDQGFEPAVTVNQEFGTTRVTVAFTVVPLTGGQDIYSVRSDDGGVTWQAAVPVATQASNELAPSIALSYTGTVIVYEDDSTGDPNIMAARSTDGGATFSGPYRVDDTAADGSMQLGPSVAVSPDGIFVAVWTDDRSGTGVPQVYSARSTDAGQTWATNVRVDDADTAQSQSAKQAVAYFDTSGVLWVVWVDDRSGSYQLRVARSYDKGQSFLPSRPLSTSLRRVGSPQGRASVLGVPAISTRVSGWNRATVVVDNDGVNPGTIFAIQTADQPISEGSGALVPNPARIRADGISTALVTGPAKDANGIWLLDGERVTVATTAGAVVDTDVDTNVAGVQVGATNGSIQFTVRSDTAPSVATVSSSWQINGAAADGSLAMTGPAVTIGSVTATPQTIPADGTSTTDITASSIVDTNGQLVADGEVVSFTATDGTFIGSDLDPGTAGFQVASQNGDATATLQSSTTGGIVNVTVTSGTTSKGTSVTFTAPTPTPTPTATVTPTPTPTPIPLVLQVIDFYAAALDGEVSLSWRNPDAATFAGTLILRRSDTYPTGPSDNGAAIVYDGQGESFSDRPLTNGTTYYYAAFAYDAAAFGPAVRAAAQPQAGLADTSPPNFLVAPTVDVSDTSALVSVRADEPVSLVVEWGTGAALGNAVSAEGTLSDNSARITGLSAGQQYYYRACITDVLGQGPTCTSTDTFTTLLSPPTDVGAIVAGPSVVNAGETSLRLAFETNVPTTADVEVFLAQARSLVRRVASTQATLIHAVDIGGLTPATSYEVRFTLTTESGLVSTTQRYPVETLAAADQSPPLLQGQPLVTNITDQTATVYVVFDEPARFDATFTPTGGAGNVRRVQSSTAKTQHVFRVVGLSPGTEYGATLSAFDTLGNGPATSSIEPFTTLSSGAVDMTAPVLVAGPEIDTYTIGSDSVDMFVITSEPARLQLRYGTSSSQLDQTVATARYEVEQSIEMTGLQPATTYYYSIDLIDPAGNQTTTPVDQVTTLGIGTRQSTGAPIFIRTPQVIWSSDDRLLFEWETDLPSETVLKLFDSGSGGGLLAVRAVPGRRRVYQALLRVDHTRRSHTGVGADTCNAQGTCASESPSPLPTPSPPDTTPPVIENVNVIYLSDDQALLNWTTDEPAAADLQWQPAGGSLRQYASPTFRQEHTVRLVGLAGASTISWSVRAVDPAGNASARRGGPPFTPPSVPDTSNPGIKTITVTPSWDRVQLNWATTEPTDAVVEFAPFTPLDQRKADMKFRPNHQVVLTRLSPGTTYSYRVGATDASGNGRVWTNVKTFTTEGEPVPLGLPAVAVLLLAVPLAIRRRWGRGPRGRRE